MGSGEVHKTQVGIHAHLQHTAFSGAVLGPGTADGSHHQHGGSGQGGCVLLTCPAGGSGKAHGLKHIHIAAVGGTAGAQGHVHTGLNAAGDISAGESRTQRGQWGGNGSGPLFTQQGFVLVGKKGAACGAGVYLENAVAGQ